jgi:integrase/recombinase XerD
MKRIDRPVVRVLPATEPTDRRPALFQTIPEGGRRFWEFFTVNVRNSHTRRAYFKAGASFAAWCAERSLGDLARVTPMHVAAYVEQLGGTHAKPTVKQHLAAIRMLFDWLVTGHVMHTNPAHAVRGPKHSVRQGKTSVLSVEEMHDLLAAIDTTSLLGLRDRALIGLMGYTFARVGAATGMSPGFLRAEAPRLGTAPREGRQGDPASLSPQSRPLSRGVDLRLRAWL